MSIISPPPTAVIVPSSTVGHGPNPTSSERNVPVTAKTPIATKSEPRLNRLILAILLAHTATTNVERNTAGRYLGSTNASGGPSCSDVSRMMSPPGDQRTRHRAYKDAKDVDNVKPGC